MKRNFARIAAAVLALAVMLSFVSAAVYVNGPKGSIIPDYEGEDFEFEGHDLRGQDIYCHKVGAKMDVLFELDYVDPDLMDEARRDVIKNNGKYPAGATIKKSQHFDLKSNGIIKFSFKKVEMINNRGFLVYTIEAVGNGVATVAYTVEGKIYDPKTEEFIGGPYVLDRKSFRVIVDDAEYEGAGSGNGFDDIPAEKPDKPEIYEGIDFKGGNFANYKDEDFEFEGEGLRGTRVKCHKVGASMLVVFDDDYMNSHMYETAAAEMKRELGYLPDRSRIVTNVEYGTTDSSVAKLVGNGGVIKDGKRYNSAILFAVGNGAVTLTITVNATFYDPNTNAYYGGPYVVDKITFYINVDDPDGGGEAPISNSELTNPVSNIDVERV